MSPRTPDQQWWTAAEIADAGLPDMPAKKRGVNDMAGRLSWTGNPKLARRRKAKGGGWEYHWTLFPSTAQTKLLTAVKVAAAPVEEARPQRDEVWTLFDGLPAAAKARAQQRLLAIQKVEAFEAGGSTRHLAVIDVAQMEGVAPRSIWNWYDMIWGVRVDDRLAYLAPRHRAARRTSRRAEIDPRFGDLIKADFLRVEQPSLTSVYDRCVRIARAEGLAVAPMHSIRRWIDRTVSKTTLTYARKGMDALLRMRPSQIRDKTFLHALEAVNADFHRFDVFVRFPAGPGGQKAEVTRPQLVAFQDILSYSPTLGQISG